MLTINSRKESFLLISVGASQTNRSYRPNGGGEVVEALSSKQLVFMDDKIKRITDS